MNETLVRKKSNQPNILVRAGIVVVAIALATAGAGRASAACRVDCQPAITGAARTASLALLSVDAASGLPLHRVTTVEPTLIELLVVLSVVAVLLDLH